MIESVTIGQIIAVFAVLTALWKIVETIYRNYFKPKDDAQAWQSKIENQLASMNAKLDEDLKRINNHEERLETLEDRMGISESDRQDIHNANRVIVSALQGLLDGSEKAKESAKKEVDNFLKSKI